MRATRSEKPKVRLTQEEIRVIKEEIRKHDPSARIIIFGSRADLSQKGGDIDILVILDKIDDRTRRWIKVAFYEKLGDRKIDLIVTDDPQRSEFTKVAYRYGVEI